MKKILSFVLTLFLLVSCSFTNKQEFANKDYSLPEYYHYDSTDFIEKCDELKEYINNNDCDNALAAYDQLYDELLEVEDLSNICFIDYSENINDDYYSDEQQYIDNIFDDLSNKFLTLCHLMSESEFSNDFKSHIDNELLFNDFVDYIEKSDEEIELLAEETRLQQEYYKINDTIDDYTFTYNGKTYTYDEIIDVSDTDYDLFSILYDGYSSKVNADLGKIYLKLVKVRDKIAKLNGYDNYALYADTEIYSRDYSFEDLANLKAAAKKYGSIAIEILYSYYDYGSNNISGDKLLKDVTNIVTKISPLTQNAYDVLYKNDLYSISYGDGRYDGSYESSFVSKDSAFIFLNLSNSYRDYFTMAHEFGHFTNAIAVKNPCPFTREGCYDVLEIHSTGLEVLFGQKASNLLKDNYDTALLSNIIECLLAITDACVYDDFQRYVYANPDITLDEVNEKYKQLQLEYGWSEFGGYTGMEYDWMYVPHNFDSPMYYISYGTSYFASLQLWQESIKDYDKTVHIWEDIVTSNVYDDGYIKIVSDAGLMPFTNKDSVIDTYDKVINYIVLSTS